MAIRLVVPLRKNTFCFLFSIPFFFSGSGFDALSKAFFNGRYFTKCTNKVLL